MKPHLSLRLRIAILVGALRMMTRLFTRVLRSAIVAEPALQPVRARRDGRVIDGEFRRIDVHARYR